MTTRLYGYKLTHPEGTESEWRFIDDKANPLYVALRLKNGAWQVFSDYEHYIDKWAAVRELTVSKAVFEFDPVTMSFTREI